MFCCDNCFLDNEIKEIIMNNAIEQKVIAIFARNIQKTYMILILKKVLKIYLMIY